MRIELLSGTETLRRLDELTGLLLDVVEHGARLGFAMPLGRDEAVQYWQKVASGVASGNWDLIVALDDRARILGGALLALEPRSFGPESAVIQKLMVKHALRGRGIGAALIVRVEHEARRAGRTQLFIDASMGASGAPAFCRRLGYNHAADLVPADEKVGLNTLFAKDLPAKTAFTGAPFVGLSAPAPLRAV